MKSTLPFLWAGLALLSIGLSASAQEAEKRVTPVPAGSTAAIGTSATSPAANSAESKKLQGALTPATRKTLQDAMDSAAAR